MINAQKLLEEAQHHTGFSDFGGDAAFESSFRRLFAAMADSVSTEAQLSQPGLRGAELRLRTMAQARLQFINDRTRWPAIALENIVQPVVILGL